MAADYMIAIVGSGPAGMSAAARAAKDGKPHILPAKRHGTARFPRCSGLWIPEPAALFSLLRFQYGKSRRWLSQASSSGLRMTATPQYERVRNRRSISLCAGPGVRILLPPAGSLLRTPIEPGATRVSREPDIPRLRSLMSAMCAAGSRMCCWGQWTSCRASPQSAFLAHIGSVILKLRSGGFGSRRGNHGHHRENQNFGGVAVRRRGSPANIVDNRRDHLLRGPVDEHAFGVGRGELASARRSAGLIYQRCPLRRGFAEVDRFDLEIPAVVLDAMHLLRPREHALRAIAQHCPVFPAAFPQLVDGRDWSTSWPGRRHGKIRTVRDHLN